MSALFEGDIIYEKEQIVDIISSYDSICLCMQFKSTGGE